MGYRSDVVVLVACGSAEDLRRLTGGFPQWDAIKGEAVIREDGKWVTFEFSDVKWYTERLIHVREDGYGLYCSVEDFTRHAEAADDDFSAGEPGGVRSTGVFVRLGEDAGDAEDWRWGEEGDGLPYPWDVVHVVRGIEASWA